MSNTTPIYHLEVKLNGQTFKKRPRSTEQLKQAILEIKPEILYTEVYITVTTGRGADKVVRERRLNLVQGKSMFNSSDVLDIFIINLLIE